MIPLGNWEETNDELRNEIADLEQEIEVLQSENRTLVIEKEELQSALNAADTDIADYLFELDHLHHKHAETELDIEGLLTLVEYWQNKATGEREPGFGEDFWRRQAEELGRQNDELRNQLDESDRSHGELDFVYRNLLNSHIELKKALNTLSE